MLKYFDELVGKDLGITIFGQLMGYFSIVMTPNAFPLAVLLSSLMTFGNLGEHFELTAVKSAGISLLRTLLPIFVFTIFLSFAVYYSNNNIVPKAALDAYSLLWDIKQKKPSLDLKEGTFYNGIPGYSIKVGEKFDDNITLKDLIIYDHSAKKGNVSVFLADSGKMYSIHDDNYLVLEMFRGNSYSVSNAKNLQRNAKKGKIDPFVRNGFEQTKMVFSLASFDMTRTDKDLFAGSQVMKNITQLRRDLDSMNTVQDGYDHSVYQNGGNYFKYHLKDRIEIPKDLAERKAIRDSINLIAQKKKDSIVRAEEGLNYDKIEVVKEEKIDTSGRKRPSGDTKRPAVTEKLVKPVKEITAKQKLPKDFKPLKEIDTKKEPNLLKKNKLKNPKDSKKKVQKTAPIPTTIKNRLVAKDTKAEEKKKKKDVKPKKSKEERFTELYSISAPDSALIAKVDSANEVSTEKEKVFKNALRQARTSKNNINAQKNKFDQLGQTKRKYEIQIHKKYASAVACLVMFLIGAPLGAIIKRGGLGVPVIISVIFFIIYYVLTIMGEKWAKEAVVDPFLGVWGANFILLPFGLVFLNQARKDARLFDSDFYNVLISKLRKRLGEKSEEKE